MSKAKAASIETGPVENIRWLDDVAEHDYGAAEAYLSLKLDTEAVHKIVKRLRKAPVTRRRANDILRAAGLTAAPLDDPGVMKDLIKVIEGTESQPRSPGQSRNGRRHRGRLSPCVARSPHLHPYGEIPLKLA